MRPLPLKLFCPLALFAATGSVWSADAPASPAATELKQDSYTDAVAATVNGEVITMTQLHKLLEGTPDAPGPAEEIKSRVKDQYEKDPNMTPEQAKKILGDQINALGISMLHTMVDRLLVIQEFDSKGMKVPDAYIDQQFDDRMTTQYRGDRVAFLKGLAAHGQSESEFRQDLANDVKVGYMQGQIHNSASGISPVQIRDYYESHKEDYLTKDAVMVRQILLTPVADFPLADQAAKIVQEARLPGANFVNLAKKYSTDALSKEGDVPVYTFEKGRVRPEVEAVAFNLKPGEVSDPVPVKDDKTGTTTIFIFKCEDKTTAGYQPLEKVHGTIENILTKKEDDEAWEKWLQKLRSKAYVIYMLSA